MYLPTMTRAEITRLKEMENDACRARTIHEFERNRHLASKVLQRGAMFTNATYWLNPKSKSEYILVISIDTKKDLKDFPAMYFPIIRDKGLNLVIIDTLHQGGLILTPHFFDRYQERMQIQCESRINLIEQYIAKNWRTSSQAKAKERHGHYEDEIKIPDGAIMCQWDKDRELRIGKTFVRDDMFYKEQSDRLTGLELYTTKRLKEYTSNIYQF